MSRLLSDLNPTMEKRYLRWKNQASAQFPQFIFKEAWTRRTAQEQFSLWLQNTPTHWVTNMDGYKHPSLHQYGLAVDVFVIRKEGNGTDWSERVYLAIFSQVPPEKFGLEQIAGELGHLQAKGGYNVVRFPWLYGFGKIIKT